MATKNKNKELSFDTVSDLLSHYGNDEGIDMYDPDDLYERFIDETQGVLSQFHDFVKEEYKEELSRPICPQCEQRVDELHKINGDEELAYCSDNYDCRDQAFEAAEKKLGW